MRCLADMRLQITAAVVLQSYIRRWLAKRHTNIRLGAIITIQVYRGYNIIKFYSDRHNVLGLINEVVVYSNETFGTLA